MQIIPNVKPRTTAILIRLLARKTLVVVISWACSLFIMNLIDGEQSPPAYFAYEYNKEEKR